MEAQRERDRDRQTDRQTETEKACIHFTLQQI